MEIYMTAERTIGSTAVGVGAGLPGTTAIETIAITSIKDKKSISAKRAEAAITA